MTNFPPCELFNFSILPISIYLHPLKPGLTLLVSSEFEIKIRKNDLCRKDNIFEWYIFVTLKLDFQFSFVPALLQVDWLKMNQSMLQNGNKMGIYLPIYTFGCFFSGFPNTNALFRAVWLGGLNHTWCNVNQHKKQMALALAC